MRRGDIVGSRLERVTAAMLRVGGYATILSISGARLTTVEHLFSALFAHNIDNVIIEVNGPEVPVFDGSATFWDEAIRGAGLVKYSEKARFLIVNRTIRKTDGDRWIEISPPTGPASRVLSLDVRTVFNHPLLGNMETQFDLSADYFSKEIAWARTFCFEREISDLKASGLAKGGDLSNAVVFSDDGVVNVGGLKAKDEVLRHKALDLLGDLSILNSRLAGTIRTFMPGHTLTASLVQELFSEPNSWAIHT